MLYSIYSTHFMKFLTADAQKRTLRNAAVIANHKGLISLKKAVWGRGETAYEFMRLRAAIQENMFFRGLSTDEVLAIFHHFKIPQ